MLVGLVLWTGFSTYMCERPGHLTHHWTGEGGENAEKRDCGRRWEGCTGVEAVKTWRLRIGGVGGVKRIA